MLKYKRRHSANQTLSSGRNRRFSSEVDRKKELPRRCRRPKKITGALLYQSIMVGQVGVGSLGTHTMPVTAHCLHSQLRFTRSQVRRSGLSLSITPPTALDAEVPTRLMQVARGSHTFRKFAGSSSRRVRHVRLSVKVVANKRRATYCTYSFARLQGPCGCNVQKIRAIAEADTLVPGISNEPVKVSIGDGPGAHKTSTIDATCHTATALQPCVTVIS